MEFSNIEEDSFEAKRRERRERMKEEKRRQAAKRAMLKKMIPLIIVGIIAVIIIIGAIVFGVRALSDKHKIEEEELQAAEVIVPEIPEVVEEPEPKEPEIINMLPITVESPQMFEGYKVDTSGADVGIGEEEVQSQYLSIIDASTGKVLATRNGADRMNPASMTKVMTALVACEHITDLEDMFTITIEDTDFAYVHDLSCAGYTLRSDHAVGRRVLSCA